jgi:hypothetical protein
VLDLDSSPDREEAADEGGRLPAERHERLTVASGPPDVPLQLLVGVRLRRVEADEPGSLPPAVGEAESHRVAVADVLASP